MPIAMPPSAKFCLHCGATLHSTRIDGCERLTCTNAECGYVYWDNPLPVLAAIVEWNGLIVLTRKPEWPADRYALVAGFMEREETPEQGVLRELKEELGLDGEIVSFIGYYPFFKKNELILAYHIQADGEISLGPELADYKLIRPEALRAWKFGTGPAVRDWLAARIEQQDL